MFQLFFDAVIEIFEECLIQVERLNVIQKHIYRRKFFEKLFMLGNSLINICQPYPQVLVLFLEIDLISHITIQSCE